MKKLLLFVFALCSLTCYAQKQKQFFYDGIELRHVKGWTIVPAKDANATSITCIRLPFQIHILKQGVPQSFNAERLLQTSVEKIMEANMMASGKNPKIKEVGSVMDGYVNSIPAKYIDLTSNLPLSIILCFRDSSSKESVSNTGTANLPLCARVSGSLPLHSCLPVRKKFLIQFTSSMAGTK